VEAEILSARDISISLLFFTVQLFDLSSGVDKLHSRHTERRLKAFTVHKNKEMNRGYLSEKIARFTNSISETFLLSCIQNDTLEVASYCSLRPNKLTGLVMLVMCSRCVPLESRKGNRPSRGRFIVVTVQAYYGRVPQISIQSSRIAE
jgi:hypothetical protein